MASKVVLDAVLCPVCWTLLFSLFDYLHGFLTFLCVCELLELFPSVRVVEDFGPFAKVGADEFLHLIFEICADAELVLDDYFAEVLDATGEVFEPAGCTLEPVGCADVEHEISVDEGDDLVGWNILGKEFGVAGFSATITADEEVEALFSGDETEAVKIKR